MQQQVHQRRYVKDRYVFEGYAASHSLQIELPVDKEMLNRVLGVISQGRSGAEIQIHFAVKDTEDLRQRALAEAVRVARLSADTLAQAAGVKLGRLQSMAHGRDEIRVSGQPAYERGLSRLRRRGQNLLWIGLLERTLNRLGQLDERRAGPHSFGHSLCDLIEYERRLVVGVGEAPDNDI